MQNHKFVSFIYLCFLSLYANSLCAQTLLITNATLIDGNGSAALSDVNILIKNGLIHSVGTSLNKPLDSPTIDAKGQVVTPGLIDMHTHPTFEILTKAPRMPFPDTDSMPSSDKDMREFIETRLPLRLNRFLQGGITTVISAGGYWPFDIEIRERIYAEDLSGPRMLVASPIFTAPGGHPASGICSGTSWCVSRLSFEVSDAELARAGVRRFAAGGVQAIKLVYDSFDKTHLGGPDFNFPRLDKKVMKAIVEEAKQIGLPVIAHAKTVNETADVIEAGVDALVHSALMENPEFTTRDGSYLPQLVGEKKGMVVTTTIRAFYERLLSATPESRPQAQHNFDLVGPSLRAYAEAGASLVFGTDYDGAGLDPDPADAVRSEAQALVAAGFTEVEVISMATGNAWRHPVVPLALGSIQPGKIADILILSDDPLKDITALTRPLVVIKEGRIVIDKR
ncbi:MAG: amidohydrolase family protein [Gammaproteobacteria bacterium]|nr:amidohydrolase family protein [Gammaproteobacteria bacterium]